MSEKSYVVVFPSIFAKNKVSQLIENIKKVLKLQDQKFSSVKRDVDIILVEANDPVFASSAINLLFGIKKIAIARQIKNNFETIVSEITSLGGNLLLKGEKFLVRVEGASKGFLTKDVEVSATSSIIEKKSKLGAKPGSEKDFDKLIYAYLTKKNAYICIFIDDGLGGVPYGTQEQTAICSIFDELSAVNSLYTIKHGYNTKIIVCYRKKTELMNLVKTLNQIIPRLLVKKISLEFFHIKLKSGNTEYLTLIDTTLEILLNLATKENIQHISLPIMPEVFPGKIIDGFVRRVTRDGKIPVMPLYGSDMKIFDELKEIGLEKRVRRLESIVAKNFKKMPKVSKKTVQDSIKSKKVVTVKIGPTNVHDILDALE